VRVRSHGDDVPAAIRPRTDGTIEVVFRSPQRALAPGQSAVVYLGDEVLGGGRIVTTH
jgi:tRNA-specific 2-thiouridylase